MRTRRKFTSGFKAKVVLECISGEKSISEACREYQLSPILVNKWRIEFLENSSAIFERDHKGSEEQNHIADLERLVGRLTLENEMLKKASGILNAQASRNEK
jgi:transposase-like protein